MWLGPKPWVTRPGKASLGSPAPTRVQATRLGITTVVSTDSIRHMLRSFHPRDQAPVLWASTYQVRAAGPLHRPAHARPTPPPILGAAPPRPKATVPLPCPLPPCLMQAGEALPPSQQRQTAAETTIAGYKAQCALIKQHLGQLVANCLQRCQSLICEGGWLGVPGAAGRRPPAPTALLGSP